MKLTENEEYKEIWMDSVTGEILIGVSYGFNALKSAGQFLIKLRQEHNSDWYDCLQIQATNSKNKMRMYTVNEAAHWDLKMLAAAAFKLEFIGYL